MIDIFETNKACNTYLLWKDKQEAILVDPGYNGNNCLINHINKLGLSIKAILVTHGHYDHITALEDIIKYFPDAETFYGDDAEDEITNPKVNLSMYTESQRLTYLPKRNRTCSDHEIINICSYDIEVIKTPFHTKGSCCFFIKEENLLFSGDTLFESSIGRTDLPSGSSRHIGNSLSKLIILPKSLVIYPGHGKITTLEKELKYNPYLKNL